MGLNKLKHLILPILLVFSFFTACKGQTLSKQANTTNAAQLSYSGKHVKLTKTLGTDQYQVVGCSLKDRSGNIWFGTTGEGVYRYDGNSFTQFTEKDGLCSNSILFIVLDRSGDLWLGSKESISRFDGKKFTNISIPNAVGSRFMAAGSVYANPSVRNELWSMMQDRAGKIWLGTTDGIYCFDGKTFTPFLADQKILNTDKVSLKWTQCIFEDRSGNIWFGSWVLANEGICRFDGKSITQYKPYGEGWVRNILEDKDGALLIVTRHNGVCRFDGKDFTNFTEKGGIQNASVNTALTDSKGNLWFGTELGSGDLREDGGLWFYDGRSFTRFTRKDGLCHNGVYSILEDALGNIWVGTRNTDLCRFDGKAFTSFSN